MNDLSRTKAPWHLWVVGVVTLLWNAIGGWSYTSTQTGNLEGLGMSDEAIAYVSNFPAWADALWALGVWGAVLGSVLLLLRSRFAVHAIAVSIVGLVGTTLYQRVLSELPADMQGLVLPITIWATTLFMMWYALRMKSEGVLK
ncbi:hypothetical protein [Erythrobacter sp. THAF29]|uniref:hypothetical protein n=1 Tax=Erythrobacter sp. THAF29 TaxID=2587851 RepID=UPI001268FD06|nr:hypothetical protein [Erythrobacter sp. THAF29]QFT77103.1 hypothetical protein FIU90_06075 [Erythrobacter sp. THAF29]